MIIEVRARNFLAFEQQISFSLKADMRNKKFASNVRSFGNFNVLKVAGVYGANNSGKTNLIRSIHSIWSVLLNRGMTAGNNYFSGSPIIELGVTFIFEGREFTYDFHHDLEKGEFIYERFAEVIKDSHGNEKKEVWLLRDTIHNTFEAADERMEDMAENVARNNIIMYLVDTDKFEHIREMKRILTGFALRIDIIDMNNIPMQKTVELLKSKDASCKRVVDFIKNADLYMDDYYFADNIKVRSELSESRPQEDVLNIPDQLIEQMKLTSVYKGVRVPSVLVDSTGTKKIVALASYIVEALENGRILIIDELDSSIHFTLTRAVVAMFNNELNTNAQLIFTVHDINLMDCKHLFRKEQIWFVKKDDTGVDLYSLAEFTAQDGVRDTSDIVEKYRKGLLGGLPDPVLINSLIDLHDAGKTA